ncbi:S9 family peptidase [Pedobacter namyangjuensis]|uniref:S9 family peptidase n=1 Tax=Pedobacter namyangjuensis TaxID=600626 RepID=UPI000DE4CEA0|nr:S9 family peptidase [Pedobacter namyangjuensis]
MKLKSFLHAAAFMCWLSLGANAQMANLVAYKPSQQELLASFAKAAALDTVLRNVVSNNDISPVWHSGGNSFWYRKNMPERTWQFVYVDAMTGTSKTAFDHQLLATALTRATGKTQTPGRLNLMEMFFNDNGNAVTLKADGKWYKVNLADYQYQQATDTTYLRHNIRRPLQNKRSRWAGFRTPRKSPDGKQEISIKDGNLIVKNLADQTETALTSDGTTARPYGEATWSPDGKTIVAYLIDPKKTKQVHHILSSVTGTTRGELKSQDYVQPGDEFTSYQPYVFEVASKKQTKVATDVIDFFGAPVINWRDKDNRYYTFEKVDRGHQRFRVVEVDVATGKTRNIIDEKTKTFIYENRIYTRYLPKTNEIVWTSEQNGWQHLYLVNSLTGKQQQITKGNWVVREVDSVDIVKRQIWFRASGVNANEDPYFIHYYRIGFDGKGMIDLTPEKGNHSLTFSPDRRFYIDTYSQVNVPPVIELRKTADGKKIKELERVDAERYLKKGIKLPEVFVAKGRDGVTDIWGVICFPTNMDKDKTYPIIENIYAGPQDSFVPKNFMPNSEMQNIAELGFIVVQIDGMGTANRSKAFHDVCWKNLADAGFPDRILWMKAMAKKYPNADIDRVGLYGTSAGGQNAAGALLFHPEFYKAGVAACGCHDNRVDKQWWNEQWMGFPVGDHYAKQSNVTNAHNLLGNLLLIVGEADTNVPPESTYRMADALIKANKDFEILSIPGMGHSDGGTYGRRKKKDFFVKHLLLVDPPSRNNSNSQTK